MSPFLLYQCTIVTSLGYREFLLLCDDEGMSESGVPTVFRGFTAGHLLDSSLARSCQSFLKPRPLLFGGPFGWRHRSV